MPSPISIPWDERRRPSPQRMTDHQTRGRRTTLLSSIHPQSQPIGRSLSASGQSHDPPHRLEIRRTRGPTDREHQSLQLRDRAGLTCTTPSISRAATPASLTFRPLSSTSRKHQFENIGSAPSAADQSRPCVRNSYCFKPSSSSSSIKSLLEFFRRRSNPLASKTSNSVAPGL